MKLLSRTLIGLLILSATYSCASKKDYLEVTYVDKGNIDKMHIPLSIIEGRDKLASTYIRSVKASVLDSLTFTDNNPDLQEVHSTPVELDFTGDIKPHSPEYYAIYTVHCVDKAGKYYNSLFDNKIDFDSQEDYRDIEITTGDFPGLTSPRNYVFEPGSNPNPSLFYHEMGHRAFWYIYMDSGLGIKFKGLTYVHMGLLEYFTVSLNDSPIVGEDALPVKLVRNASDFYGYPIHDSLSLGTSFRKMKESYPEQYGNPESILRKYLDVSMTALADYLHIGNNHETGMILTSTLWRIREKLGQQVTDKLVAQTILDLNEYLDRRDSFYVPAEWENNREDRIEWCDFFYGMVMKNREINGGAEEEYIIEQFRITGFPVDGVDLL